MPPKRRTKSIIMPVKRPGATIVKRSVTQPRRNVKVVRVTKRPASHTDLEKARKRVLKARIEHLEQRKAREGKKPKRKIPWTKILLWAIVLAGLLALWNYVNIPELLLSQIEKNPALWNLYQHVEGEVAARSLLGLFYASFFGSLFFISLPVEVIFLYYLGLNYYFVQIITVVLIGNLIGMVINYAIGWLIGERALMFFMKKSYPKFKQKIEKTGAFIVLIGNIIPFPIELFAVFLGAIRYSFSRYMLYTIIGKIAKFILLYLGFTYFVKYASPYLSTISVDWFIQTIRDVFVFW